MCPVGKEVGKRLYKLLSDKGSVTSEEILKELNIPMTMLAYVVCGDESGRFQIDENGVVSLK